MAAMFHPPLARGERARPGRPPRSPGCRAGRRRVSPWCGRARRRTARRPGRRRRRPRRPAPATGPTAGARASPRAPQRRAGRRRRAPAVSRRLQAEAASVPATQSTSEGNQVLGGGVHRRRRHVVHAVTVDEHRHAADDGGDAGYQQPVHPDRPSRPDGVVVASPHRCRPFHSAPDGRCPGLSRRGPSRPLVRPPGRWRSRCARPANRPAPARGPGVRGPTTTPRADPPPMSSTRRLARTAHRPDLMQPLRHIS